MKNVRSFIARLITRIAVALLVLMLGAFNSLSPVHAASTYATKKDLTNQIRLLKKQNPSLKLTTLTAFSRAPLTYDFAIQKVCTSFKWPVSPKQYSRCRAYAEKNELLAAPLEVNPANPKTARITTEQLNTLLTRSLSLARNKKSTNTTSANFTSQPPSTGTKTTTVTSSSSSVPPRVLAQGPTVARDASSFDVQFFSTVQLDAPLPKQFYVGELYLLSGTVRSGTTNEIFAFTCSQNGNCDSTTNYTSTVANDRFSIPVYFDQPGSFNIGIVPGRSGESRLAPIDVLAQEPPVADSGNQNAPAAQNLRTGYASGKTSFSWDKNGFTITANTPVFTRVVVFQNTTRADILTRQGATTIKPDSLIFKNFKPGAAWWIVEQNGTASSPVSITLTEQQFYKVETKNISVSALKDWYAEASGTLNFRGRAINPLSNRLVVTLPNGTVKETVINAQNYSAGDDITFSYALDRSGVYIFEINDLNGAAAVNVPVYVGGLTPLIPDFFATHDQKLSTTPVGDIHAARQTMLRLINTDRQNNGIAPVVLDDSLNGVAQGHSQSMLTNNFFGHTDTLGRTPDDRRRAAHIQTPIRENLGKSSSIELAQAGLMRSPVHRDAILDPTMKRVGIGIVKNAEGYYLLTQNYSGNPLDESSVQNLKNELLTEANSFRQLKSMATLTEDAAASRAATEWATTMASQNFFELACPAQKTCPHATVSQAVRGQGIRSAYEVYTVRTGNQSGLSDELFAQTALSDGAYHTIGMGLAVGDFGDIYLVVLYL